MGYIRKIFVFLLFLVTTSQGECSDLILILVCDTKAENIEDTVFKDLDNIRAEANRIALYAEMNLIEMIFTGETLRANEFLNTLNTISIQPDDTVFFYFSGHGYRTSSKGLNPWPYFYFTLSDQGVDYGEVISLLRAKQPRLLLTIADCCNNIIEEEFAPPLAQKRPSKKMARVRNNYKKLFAESGGEILITSSEWGELSWCIPRGAVYTLAWLQSLKKESENRKQASWRNLLKDSSRAVRRYQIPYYELNI